MILYGFAMTSPYDIRNALYRHGHRGIRTIQDHIDLRNFDHTEMGFLIFLNYEDFSRSLNRLNRPEFKRTSVIVLSSIINR